MAVDIAGMHDSVLYFLIGAPGSGKMNRADSIMRHEYALHGDGVVAKTFWGAKKAPPGWSDHEIESVGAGPGRVLSSLGTAITAFLRSDDHVGRRVAICIMSIDSEAARDGLLRKLKREIAGLVIVVGVADTTADACVVFGLAGLRAQGQEGDMDEDELVAAFERHAPVSARFLAEHAGHAFSFSTPPVDAFLASTAPFAPTLEAFLRVRGAVVEADVHARLAAVYRVGGRAVSADLGHRITDAGLGVSGQVDFVVTVDGAAAFLVDAKSTTSAVSTASLARRHLGWFVQAQIYLALTGLTQCFFVVKRFSPRSTYVVPGWTIVQFSLWGGIRDLLRGHAALPPADRAAALAKAIAADVVLAHSSLLEFDGVSAPDNDMWQLRFLQTALQNSDRFNARALRAVQQASLLEAVQQQQLELPTHSSQIGHSLLLSFLRRERGVRRAGREFVSRDGSSGRTVAVQGVMFARAVADAPRLRVGARDLGAVVPAFLAVEAAEQGYQSAKGTAAYLKRSLVDAAVGALRREVGDVRGAASLDGLSIKSSAGATVYLKDVGVQLRAAAAAARAVARSRKRNAAARAAARDEDDDELRRAPKQQRAAKLLAIEALNEKK